MIMNFRSISLLRRPHTRPFASQPPPAPHASSPRPRFNLKAILAAKAKARAERAEREKKPLRDDKIPYRLVRVVDSETGKLSDIQPLKAVLGKCEDRKHYVELITETPEPIVKIFNRYVETTRAAEAAHRAREVVRQNMHKEVQLSWGAAPADLAHKVNKAREDLLRGVRVDLVFARKAGQRRLGAAVMQQRASEAIKGLLDVCKERKERDVRPAQGLLAIFLEGTTRAAADTRDTTKSQPEPFSGKKFVLLPDSTLTDQEHLIRRMHKEFIKGARVELVLSGKAGTPKDEPLTVDELQVRAGKLLKPLEGEGVNEWRERVYKPVSAKLSMFLWKDGKRTKDKVVVHKGPKLKKMKPGDIPNLTDD